MNLGGKFLESSSSRGCFPPDKIFLRQQKKCTSRDKKSISRYVLLSPNFCPEALPGVTDRLAHSASWVRLLSESLKRSSSRSKVAQHPSHISDLMSNPNDMPTCKVQQNKHITNRCDFYYGDWKYKTFQWKVPEEQQQQNTFEQFANAFSMSKLIYVRVSVFSCAEDSSSPTSLTRSIEVNGGKFPSRWKTK